MNNLNVIDTTTLVRAIVVATNDPQKRGRVRVRIPSLHGIPFESSTWVDDTNLPWALPGVFNAAGNDMGQRLVPPIGTRVFVLFEEGNTSKPVYIGGIPQLIGEPKLYNIGNTETLGTVTVTTDDTVADIDYTHDPAAQGIVFKSLKGFTIYFDDTDGFEKVRIVDQAGQVIEMESLAPITERRGDMTEPTAPSRITIKHNDETLFQMDDNGFTLTI